MGVTVREKKKGSGIYWIFIRHASIRRSKQIGPKNKALAIADIVRGKLAEGDLGLMDLTSKTSPTFKELSKDWLDNTVATTCRITTYNRYKSVLRMYVNPKIGTLPIKELTRPQVKNVLRSIVTKGLSRSSVEEVELILTTTQQRKPEYYPLFLLLFRTGMRLGEALALTWQGIDFHNGRINVSRSWRNGVMTGTKTGKTRQVDMSDQLLLEMRNLLKKRREEALRKGRSEPLVAIFHDKKDGHLSQNSVRNVWKRILVASGLNHRKVHTTRHTFTSILLAKGVPIPYVSKTLGHASIQMTVDIYGHLLPDRDRSAINLLDVIHADGTPMTPAQKETLVTNEDYGGFMSMVAMQGVGGRFINILTL